MKENIFAWAKRRGVALLSGANEYEAWINKDAAEFAIVPPACIKLADEDKESGFIGILGRFVFPGGKFLVVAKPGVSGVLAREARQALANSRPIASNSSAGVVFSGVVISEESDSKLFLERIGDVLGSDLVREELIGCTLIRMERGFLIVRGRAIYAYGTSAEGMQRAFKLIESAYAHKGSYSAANPYPGRAAPLK